MVILKKCVHEEVTGEDNKFDVSRTVMWISADFPLLYVCPHCVGHRRARREESNKHWCSWWCATCPVRLERGRQGADDPSLQQGRRHCGSSKHSRRPRVCATTWSALLKLMAIMRESVPDVICDDIQEGSRRKMVGPSCGRQPQGLGLCQAAGLAP